MYPPLIFVFATFSSTRRVERVNLTNLFTLLLLLLCCPSLVDSVECYERLSWDDYTPSSGNSKPEKIVILGSGWAALNALRKCAAPSKEIVVVSPRPHFLYTPLLASSSVG